MTPEEIEHARLEAKSARLWEMVQEGREHITGHWREAYEAMIRFERHWDAFAAAAWMFEN